MYNFVLFYIVIEIQLYRTKVSRAIRLENRCRSLFLSTLFSIRLDLPLDFPIGMCNKKKTTTTITTRKLVILAMVVDVRFEHLNQCNGDH